MPLTLWLYRKLMKKKGFRFGFQTALISFALSMLTMSVAYVEWIPSQIVRLAIAACVISFLVSLKLPRSYDQLGKE